MDQSPWGDAKGKQSGHPQNRRYFSSTGSLHEIRDLEMSELAELFEIFR